MTPPPLRAEDLVSHAEGLRRLARSLVQQLEAAGSDCTQEMEKAIEDADDYALDVTDVSISGSTATAKVRRGEDGPTETMEFTQEGGQWRATSLSG